MNLTEADKIRMDWAKFLEITHGKLMVLFFNNIPQGLLPYRKNEIEKALDVVSNHFISQGNREAVKVIESTLPFLNLYVDDKKAISSAVKNFSDKKYLEAIMTSLEHNK